LDEISAEKVRLELELENLQKEMKEEEELVEIWKENNESHDKMLSILGSKLHMQEELNKKLEKF